MIRPGLALRDQIARALARIMEGFAFDRRYFDLWQRHGYHVRPVHSFSPLPDTSALPDRIWESASALPGVDLNESGQLRLLAMLRNSFSHEYADWPARRQSTPPRFFFDNNVFESVDAELLYGLIRLARPRRLIEIGSGYSTLLAAEALAHNRAEGSDGELIAIDPNPRPFLHDQLPFPVSVRAEHVQTVPIGEFEALEANDVVFIDSTHVCKVGSDVQFEILEIVPRLKPGVLVHFHDIFLPFDYPKEWIMERHRFWNEQYMVHAFISCNSAFRIIWAGSWMHLKHPEKLAAAFPSYDPGRHLPGSLWIVRNGAEGNGVF